MKVIQKVETIFDEVRLPASFPFVSDIEQGRYPEKLLAQEAVSLYMAENPDVSHMTVSRAFIHKPMDRFEKVIRFQAVVQRDILKPELSDCGPIPLEERPWYVRPRRLVMRRQS